MSGHRALQDELVAEHEGVDPGASGTINVDRDQFILNVVTTTGESRVLAAPPVVGLRCTINLKTDGGDLTITQAGSGAFNAAGNTTITLDDAGDHVDLISIDVGGTKLWRVPGNGAAFS